MARTVFCKKYQRELEGLNAPPYPGPRGQEIFESVSRQAWQDWQAHQTMLINEKHLSLADPAARKYLQQEMDKFLAGEDYDRGGGLCAARGVGPTLTGPAPAGPLPAGP